MSQNKVDTNQNQQKVALGLSGGVDSALAAHLLVEQGYQVTAVRFPCLNQASCRNQRDRLDAEQIAEQLGIPFVEQDLPQQYQQQIVDYFISEYEQGRTPNPDVICNQIIKFGWFYQWAMANNFQMAATGHYAQIAAADNGRYFLSTSADENKDQTYFLHRLQQEQLPQIIFPIGHLQKTQVRQLAKKYQLPVAAKKDSTGLCFVCNMSVQEYLQDKLGTKPGPVVDTAGKTIGTHQGLWFYTIGQRKGFTVNKKLVQQKTDMLTKDSDLPPLYVVGKNLDNNQLIVGPRREAQSKNFTLTDLHLINPDLELSNLPLQVKIRHQGRLISCQLRPAANQQYQIELAEAVFGVSPGQFAVLYTEPDQLAYKLDAESASLICLGGAVICR